MDELNVEEFNVEEFKVEADLELIKNQINDIDVKTIELCQNLEKELSDRIQLFKNTNSTLDMIEKIDKEHEAMFTDLLKIDSRIRNIRAHSYFYTFFNWFCCWKMFSCNNKKLKKTEINQVSKDLLLEREDTVGEILNLIKNIQKPSHLDNELLFNDINENTIEDLLSKIFLNLSKLEQSIILQSSPNEEIANRLTAIQLKSLYNTILIEIQNERLKNLTVREPQGKI